MNPRYPQPQAAPVDGMTRQLQQLAALKGLGEHEQFQQQQLQQNDDASRMSAALHLLGLQQQGQEQQGREAFQNQQLALEGQRNQGEQDFRNTSLKNEQDYHQQQAKIQMFGELSRFPGMNMHNALNVSGFDDPTLAAERAQAIERVYPMLKLVTDPNARETVGRAQLSQYPGAYEEALSKAFPQAAVGGSIPVPNGPTDVPPDLQGLVNQGQQAQGARATQQQSQAQALSDQQKRDAVIHFINSTLPPTYIQRDPSGGMRVGQPAGGSTFSPALGF